MRSFDSLNSNIDILPIGHILTQMGNNAPRHYLKCDGATYNIGDYPYLEAHFKEEFGSVNYFGGNGVNTFAVPDLRGEFLRGSGTASRNTGSGAEVGVHQDGTVHKDIVISSAGVEIRAGYNSPNIANYDRITYSNKRIVISKSSTDTTQVAENYTARPTNTAVLYCIKYE